MLENGYYVLFHGVDDYYVKGKSWYKEKHFGHDGLICGVDNETKEYIIAAYDKQWIYRTFKTPQRGFAAGVFQPNKLPESMAASCAGVTFIIPLIYCARYLFSPASSVDISASL